MPIFDFQCLKCHNVVMDVLTNKDSIKCIKCKKSMIKLIPSGQIFKLKGEGFYNPSKI